jgi:sugar phosphate isomerase/epimerase
LPPPPAWAAAAQPFFKRINKPIGIQLYTLGEAAQKDLSGTLTRLAATGYKDFELPSLYGRSAKDLRAEGDKAGVKFSSIHMGLPRAAPGSLTLMSSPQEIADALGTLQQGRAAHSPAAR